MDWFCCERDHGVARNQFVLYAYNVISVISLVCFHWFFYVYARMEWKESQQQLDDPVSSMISC